MVHETVNGWTRMQESSQDIFGRSNEVWEHQDTGDQLIVEGAPEAGMNAVTYLPNKNMMTNGQIVRVGGSFKDAQKKAREWMKKFGRPPESFRTSVANGENVFGEPQVNDTEVEKQREAAKQEGLF